MYKKSIDISQIWDLTGFKVKQDWKGFQSPWLRRIIVYYNVFKNAMVTWMTVDKVDKVDTVDTVDKAHNIIFIELRYFKAILNAWQIWKSSGPTWRQPNNQHDGNTKKKQGLDGLR